MNASIVFTHSTIPELLVKWTLLLTLAWLAHWVIRCRHARLRLILWRSVLCFGLVLPMTPFLPIPVVKMPIQAIHYSVAEMSDPIATISSAGALQSPPPTVRSTRAPAVKTLNGELVSHFASQTLRKRTSRAFFLSAWALGFLWGAVRLLGFHLQLHRLRKQSGLPDPEIRQILEGLQHRLGIRQAVGLRVSDTIGSPFVCGVLRPTILLPTSMAQQLPPREASALLSHEIAHLRHNDLLWCVCWQWMKALYWFHPLVGQIPSTHNLACEQEADRIASRQLEDPGFYAQALAQLTLRVLSLPAVETKLSLNGASQIVRRLNYLAREEVGSWKWKHSLVSFALVGTLFLATSGWEFSTIAAADAKQPAERSFKEANGVGSSASGEFHWSVAMREHQTVEVRIARGSIRVLPSEDDAVRVDAHTDDPQRGRIQATATPSGMRFCSVLTTVHGARNDGEASEETSHDQDDLPRTDVVLHVPAGVHVAGSTLSGDITAQHPGADIDMATHDGDVTLQLAAEEGVNFSGNLIDGSIDSVFPLEDNTPPLLPGDKPASNAPRIVHAMLGAGGPRLTAVVVKGNIRLLRL